MFFMLLSIKSMTGLIKKGIINVKKQSDNFIFDLVLYIRKNLTQ